MKFTKFVENSYAQATHECSKDYSVFKDGQTKAAIFLISLVRSFYKWVSVPYLVVSFILVKAGCKAAPVNPLEELQKKVMAEKAQAKAAKDENESAPQLSLV